MSPDLAASITARLLLAKKPSGGRRSRRCRWGARQRASVLEREVKPHVPDAWIDTKKRDVKDGRVGLVGYEINFNRYTPPRPLEEIESDIRDIETDIVRMLAEITGSNSG